MRQRIPKIIREKIQEILYEDPVISLSPNLIAGAEEGICTLNSLGFQYHLISRRKTKEPVIALLKKRKLWPFYFSEANTFFVKRDEDKNEKAKELGVSIYTDDQPSVIEKLTDIPVRFLFDYFKVYGEKVDYKKVHSWPEFLKALSEI